MQSILALLSTILFLVLCVAPISMLLLAPVYALWPVATVVAVVGVIAVLLAARYL